MFPEVSVTVHVTVVIPNGNDSGASFVIDSIPMISLTFGSPSSTKFSSNDDASTIRSFGASIVGEVVSTTVTF